MRAVTLLAGSFTHSAALCSLAPTAGNYIVERRSSNRVTLPVTPYQGHANPGESCTASGACAAMIGFAVAVEAGQIRRRARVITLLSTGQPTGTLRTLPRTKARQCQ